MPQCVAVAACTNVGLVRPSNQDVVIRDGMLAGVADGMGGHKGGEIASAETRDSIVEALRGKTPDIGLLTEAVRNANAAVLSHARNSEELNGMGTTVTLLWLGEDEALIAHVGDSRCYRLKNGELHQMTNDHSMGAELVRAGLLTNEEAASHPMRNVITRAVGTDDVVDVDAISVPRQRGDRWLLCSDGLHGLVADEEIRAILCREADPEKAADALLHAALEAGGRDNVTVVIVDDGEGRA